MILHQNDVLTGMTVKDRCPWCRRGWRAARDAGGLWWHYPPPRQWIRIYCPATPIRERQRR